MRPDRPDRLDRPAEHGARVTDEILLPTQPARLSDPAAGRGVASHLQPSVPMKGRHGDELPAWLRGPVGFAFLSALVGLLAGLGAVVFRGLIAVFHSLFFLGRWSFVYDANAHTPPGPWGPFIIVVPVIGAAGVALLVKRFAPEARGNGVPEVMEVMHFQGGRIRPLVALIKPLASALTIGSGGSAGREGPIAQIGSAVASMLGQALHVSGWQRLTLLACGAGAGIAATFNTPVGGLLFAVEIIMTEVSVRTLVPVIIATAVATGVGRAILQSHPAFVIPTLETPEFHATAPLLLLAYVSLGLIVGAVSALFIASIYRCEDFFQTRIGGGYLRQHLGGMLAVGVLLYATLVTTGHYHVQGVGYATIQDVLNGVHLPVLLLSSLLALKLLVTSLTLGSGASGGIFSPALFLGATVGAGYGTLLGRVFPALGVSSPAFAVAGMAGVAGASTGAAAAAVVMVIEMTFDYGVIVPVMLTVAVSYAVRKSFSTESIYTMKLARHGARLPQALRSSLVDARTAVDIMSREVRAVPAGQAVSDATREASSARESSVLLLTEGECIVGWISRETVLRAQNRNDGSIPLLELAERKFVVVDARTALPDVIAAMRVAAASLALVADDDSSPVAAGRVKGVIGVVQITKALLETPQPSRGNR